MKRECSNCRYRNHEQAKRSIEKARVAFEIETDNDADNVTVEEMLAGMRKRLEYLESHPTEAKEAFGVFDTFEIDSQFV